jgi:hypothetical protein
VWEYKQLKNIGYMWHLHDKEADNSLNSILFRGTVLLQVLSYQFELSMDGRKASCFRAQLNTRDELQQ